MNAILQAKQIAAEYRETHVLERRETGKPTRSTIDELARAVEMIPDPTYNGWSNYPTWAVNLWLSNDSGLYEATQEIVAQGLTYAEDHPNVPSIWTQDEANKFGVADALKTWVVDDLDPSEFNGGAGIPDLGATMAADLLAWAFDHVNWEEIAASWLEDSVAVL